MEGVGRGRALTIPAWMSNANNASSSSNSAPGGLSNGHTSHAPAQTSAPASSASKASDWAEHTTADGKKYYHNKVTKQTTWEKPNDLKSAEELAVGSSPWKEYTSDNGRKYYYNTVTHVSSWEVPADYKAAGVTSSSETAASPAVAESPKPAAAPSAASSQQPVPASPVYVDKKDAIQAFKDLLASVGVKPTWSWEMAQGQISHDPRYKALKSMGEKRQAFSEYCQQRKKQDEEDRRRKERQVKEDFFLMLKDHKEINAKMSWRKAQALVETDSRYLAVDDRDRELLFEEFLYETERRDREEATQNRKDNMLKFKQFLEATPSVTSKTQWRKLKETLADQPLFRTLDKLDSLTVFEDHMLDLDQKEEEDNRVEKEKLKRESRKSRDAFRDLLREKLDNGELTPKTKWPDFVKGIKADERYNRMFDTTGSTPQELFSDFQEDLDEQLDKDKRVLRDIVKETNFTVGLTTTFEEFEAALQSHERFITIPKQHLKLLHLEMVDKAQSKEYSNQKRKKKLISAFKDLLKGNKELTTTSTWVDVRPSLVGQKEFDALDDEQEREKTFTDYIAHLIKKQKEKEEEKQREKEEGEPTGLTGSRWSDDEDEDGGKRHKKKEHKSKSKKHRHRDDKDRDKDREKKKDKASEKRHTHSSSDDEHPSKKHKRDKKDKEDIPMEEQRDDADRDRDRDRDGGDKDRARDRDREKERENDKERDEKAEERHLEKEPTETKREDNDRDGDREKARSVKREDDDEKRDRERRVTKKEEPEERCTQREKRDADKDRSREEGERSDGERDVDREKAYRDRQRDRDKDRDMRDYAREEGEEGEYIPKREEREEGETDENSPYRR